MKQPTFIKNLIQKYYEKNYNKPKYRLQDLYIGEITYINSSTDYVDENSTTHDIKTKCTYKPVKKFGWLPTYS